MSERHVTCECSKCGWKFIVFDVPKTDCYEPTTTWFCPHCGKSAQETGSLWGFVATHRTQIDGRAKFIMTRIGRLTDSDRHKIVRNDTWLRRLAVKEGAL